MRWLGFVPARSQTGKRPEEDAPAQITDGWMDRLPLALFLIFPRRLFCCRRIGCAHNYSHKGRTTRTLNELKLKLVREIFGYALVLIRRF